MPPRENLELTTTEKEVLAVCREHKEAHGVIPPVTLIANKLGVYRNTVYNALRNLQRKGHLVERPITEMRLTLSAKGKKVGL
jgi:Mn-dependent DtxR family transcriptional regulator